MSVDHATAPVTTIRSPGSQGEHLLQSVYGSGERADRFYRDQVCHRLLPTMVEFVARMEMMFVATADGHGECDATLRAGPHVGILMVDFVQDLIGLHINGSARIVEDDDLRAAYPDLPTADVPGRRAALWVVVTVEEAYIHCRKHIPRMAPVPRDRAWGTDDVRRKGGDYFGAAAEPKSWNSRPL